MILANSIDFITVDGEYCNGLHDVISLRTVLLDMILKSAN